MDDLYCRRTKRDVSKTIELLERNLILDLEESKIFKSLSDNAGDIMLKDKLRSIHPLSRVQLDRLKENYTKGKRKGFKPYIAAIDDVDQFNIEITNMRKKIDSLRLRLK